MAITADPVSCFPVPALDEMPDDIRDRMLVVQEKAGFIPNVFLLLARRPAPPAGARRGTPARRPRW